MPVSRLALCTAGAALAAAGCAPAARLEPLPVLESENWSAPAAPGLVPAKPLAELFGSAQLAALTQQALARNTDIAIAEARVAQAHALLRGARQATLPAISASAGASRERKPGSALPDFRDAFARLDIELDLDLFGKLRAERSAALSRTRAASLEAEAVRLAVESDVASAYVQAQALAARMAILERGIARAEELERVIKVRVQEGAATRVDLGLQTIHVLKLREQHSRLEDALDETRSALALLTGQEAPRFALPAGDISALAEPDLVLPTPAEVLAARPDVGAAEALIGAANGDVRAARASFFPQVGLSLSGLLGNVIDGPLSKTVTVGSSLLAPIFSRGKLESELAYASAVQVEAVERYRQAILTALKEADDAASGLGHSAERARLIDAIVTEAATTARSANLQYIEGEEDLLSLLDAQELLNDAEDAQVLATQEQLFARIALYRAAGGARAGTLAQAAASPRLPY